MRAARTFDALRSWRCERGRGEKLLNRFGHQVLQFSIEHGGDLGYFRVAELSEERGRLVVLHTGLSVFVLVEQHPQRCIKAGPDVMLGHLDGEERIANEILDRFFLLADQGAGVIHGRWPERA